MTNVIGFMDGLGFMTEFKDERIMQNAYYCSYDFNLMANYVLLFGPNGKVCFVPLIILRGWANGTLTACSFSHITKKISDYKICMDQGFH